MELSIIAMVGTSFLLTVVPAFLQESLAKNFLLDGTQGCGEGKLPWYGTDGQGSVGARIVPYRMGSKINFGPGGVNLSGGGKALRKMQHSCIF